MVRIMEPPLTPGIRMARPISIPLMIAIMYFMALFYLFLQTRSIYAPLKKHWKSGRTASANALDNAEEIRYSVLTSAGAPRAWLLAEKYPLNLLDNAIEGSGA